MSNKLEGNPLVIDTAGLITNDPKRATKMRWHPNAANNDLVVAHADGEVIWPIRAIATAADNESVGCEEINFVPAFPCRGLKVITIDAGTLYVFLDTVV